MLFKKSRASLAPRTSQDEANLQRLRAIEENVASISFTPRGDILTANSLFLQAVGYSEQEVLGKHHRLFCEDSFRNSPAYDRFWSALASGVPQRGVFKRIAKNGSVIWLEATYFPVKDDSGRVFEVLKIACDVTKEHAGMLVLTALSEALDRSMAMIEFTPDGEIIDANDNFLRLMGYSLGSLKGATTACSASTRSTRRTLISGPTSRPATSTAATSSARPPPATSCTSRPATTR